MNRLQPYVVRDPKLREMVREYAKMEGRLETSAIRALLRVGLEYVFKHKSDELPPIETTTQIHKACWDWSNAKLKSLKEAVIYLLQVGLALEAKRIGGKKK